VEELIEKIMKLKKEREAVFLVHNYQLPEVQDVADYLGDSLGLSQKAAQSKAKVILFCGVHFMAETASLLCPDKIVLIPELEAGCPMANMIDGEGLQKIKKKNPGVPVVSYVNTTAEVKAESDVCCTSANAAKVVNSLDPGELIFVPDKYLGRYVQTQTDKRLILWEGYCPVHIRILKEDILKLKEEHPEAEVVVHPECRPEVIALADRVLSTTGMCHYVCETQAVELIIGTEVGILHRLRKENPDKIFYPASDRAVCDNMKKITLEKVLWSLEEMKYEVKVEGEIKERARKAIKRMLQYSRTD